MLVNCDELDLFPCQSYSFFSCFIKICILSSQRKYVNQYLGVLTTDLELNMLNIFAFLTIWSLEWRSQKNSQDVRIWVCYCVHFSLWLLHSWIRRELPPYKAITSLEKIEHMWNCDSSCIWNIICYFMVQADIRRRLRIQNVQVISSIESIHGILNGQRSDQTCFCDVTTHSYHVPSACECS